MAQGWEVPAAGRGSLGAGLGVCTGCGRRSQTILLPSGGSREGITGKAEHKNKGCACSMVHLSGRL